MSETPDTPRTGSAARTWLRILAWSIPGFSAPALVLGAFLLSYGNHIEEGFATVGAFAILGVLVVGCAFFDNILHIPRPPADGLPVDPVRKFHGKRFALFLVLQLFLTPAIGFATGSACTAIFGL